MTQGLRVGSLVYHVWQGLGVLAKSFYDAGVVTHPVIVTRSSLDWKRPPQKDWYPADTPKQPIGRIHATQVVEYWRRHDVGVALFFETPFDWGLLRECRRVGIRTALMPMHECTPTKIPHEPDAWLCPSLLDYCVFARQDQERYQKDMDRVIHLENYPQFGDGDGRRKCHYVPVPVDVDKVPWKKRERCQVFVHNAGHGGLKGRNGTQELVKAMEFVKSGARLSIATQSRGEVRATRNIEVIEGTLPYESLFKDGDCFVFPEKFNGLSLPLQEARASGMLVMCGDRFPMNAWLPREPLIPVAGYRKNKIGPPYLEFDEALVEPRDIAATMDVWYDKDISEYSEQGREWAERMSWANLKPKYLEVLESLL